MTTFKLEQYNEAPSMTKLIAVIKETFADARPFDSDKDYWQNDDATVVFATKEKMTPADKGMLSTLNPDELDYYTSKGETIIRMWWD